MVMRIINWQCWREVMNEARVAFSVDWLTVSLPFDADWLLLIPGGNEFCLWILSPGGDDLFGCWVVALAVHWVNRICWWYCCCCCCLICRVGRQEIRGCLRFSGRCRAFAAQTIARQECGSNCQRWIEDIRQWWTYTNMHFGDWQIQVPGDKQRTVY